MDDRMVHRTERKTMATKENVGSCMSQEKANDSIEISTGDGCQ